MAGREWNVARNGQFGRQAKSAGFRSNPREHAGTRPDQARKNPNRERLGFCYWWRRRELNPRPQALRYRTYMLIQSIDLAPGYPTGRENQEPAPSFLA